MFYWTAGFQIVWCKLYRFEKFLKVKTKRDVKLEKSLGDKLFSGFRRDLPLSVSLIWFILSDQTWADHVLYLWIIMVRECYDILPVITPKNQEHKAKWNVYKRWKSLVCFSVESANNLRFSCGFRERRRIKVLWINFLVFCSKLASPLSSLHYFVCFEALIQVTIWIPALLIKY